MNYSELALTNEVNMNHFDYVQIDTVPSEILILSEVFPKYEERMEAVRIMFAANLRDSTNQGLKLVRRMEDLL